MRVDTAQQSLAGIKQSCASPQPDEHVRGYRIIQVEPDDLFETVLVTLCLQPEPVILLIAEQGCAFHDRSHFVQLRQVCSPGDVSFVFLDTCRDTLTSYAQEQGFVAASSLEEAFHILAPIQEKQFVKTEQEDAAHSHSRAPEEGNPQQKEEEVSGLVQAKEFPDDVRAIPVVQETKSTRRLLKNMILLIVLTLILLPLFFLSPPKPQATLSDTTNSVGYVTFSSSGQLDPTSTRGLNDIVTLKLHTLPEPASQKRYYAWLLPDSSDDTTKPLLVGSLSIMQGNAQLTYTHPDHENLLATFSRFLITEQDRDPQPTQSSPDRSTWRYQASIPTTPTPGDEKHFSLLDHLRHLLAKDQTLQHIGLAGGLDIWLYRNTEKILEWATAARDSWASGQPGDLGLVHRHMIRELDYLDGAAYVATSGDLPPDTPLLVDPLAGRLGLLEISQTQALPSYLTHIDLHLQGLSNAPGHTKAQQQLAITIDRVLQHLSGLLQTIRKDAATLVKMDISHLKGPDALALLDAMVTNATDAYVGQFDPKIGGNTDGVIWIHQQLQMLATLPITPVER